MNNITIENKQARQLLSNYNKIIDKGSIKKNNDKIKITINDNDIETSYSYNNYNNDAYKNSFRIKKILGLNISNIKKNNESSFFISSSDIERALKTFNKKDDVNIFSSQEKIELSCKNDNIGIEIESKNIESESESESEIENIESVESIDTISIEKLEHLFMQHSQTVSKLFVQRKLINIWFEKGNVVSTNSFQMLVTEKTGLKLNKIGINQRIMKILLNEFKEIEKKDKNNKVSLKVMAHKDHYSVKISFTVNNVKTVIETNVIRNYIYWDSIFNKEGFKNYNKYNIEIKEYKNTLKKLKNFVNKKRPAVKFTIGNDGLILESSLKTSKFKTKLKVLNEIKALKNPIGLSFFYLESYLKIEKKLKEINLYIKDNNNIVFFKNGNNTYIIMPMDLE